MYLECGRDLSCPSSLWRHMLPGFSSASWVCPPASMFLAKVTASRFLAGNREAELKPTTFSSLPFFLAFLSFLVSWPPHRYSTFECCLLWLLLSNIYIKQSWSLHSGVNAQQSQEKKNQEQKIVIVKIVAELQREYAEVGKPLSLTEASWCAHRGRRTEEGKQKRME